MTTSTDTSAREITSTRIINAPRELVYEVWTTPEHVIQWWGPEGFTNTFEEMEVKPGGVWRFIMHGPDGRDYPNKITFTEVVKNEKLAYEHTGDMDNDPTRFSVTVIFEAVGKMTQLTMRMVFVTAEQREKVVKEYGALEGQKQTLNKLEEFVTVFTNDNPPADRFVISREFDAPRDLVFAALSNEEALGKWWGPKGCTIVVKRFEFKPGGMFLYSMNTNGNIMWGRFIYRDIQVPERIVFINSFSDENGGITRAPFFDGKWPLEMLNVLTLKEKDGKTLLTIQGTPINATVAEHELYKTNFGNMQQGFGGTFDQLDEYLASQKG